MTANHNPAASYDLGTFVAAGNYGEEDVARFAGSAALHVDRETVDYAAKRFEREFDDWCDAQAEAGFENEA